MRCLDYKECAAWCRDHGYPVTGRDGRPAPALAGYFHLVPLSYPRDSGACTGFAQDVMQWFARGGDLLLWVDQWDQRPRMQHMPLFTRLRQALNERRPLIEAPGQLVDADDLDDALSVLVVALLFRWDCHVFSAAPGPVFFCCRDEWNGFFVPPGGSATEVAAVFSKWVLDDHDRVPPA